MMDHTSREDRLEEETFAVSDLPAHICLIWDSLEDYRFTASRYVQAGCRNNERCLCMLDDYPAEQLREDLRALGCSVSADESAGRLVISSVGEQFHAETGFDPQRTIGQWKRLAGEAAADGYAGLRVVGEATFAFTGDGAVDERLVGYESEINRQIFPAYRFNSLCIYEKKRYPVDILKKVIQSHPMMIRNRKLYRRNIYYIPPEQFRGDSSADEIDYLLDNVERGNAAFEEEMTLRERMQLALKEKEMLLREIHHRVKNNLNVVYSLLSFQLRQSRNLKTRETLLKTQNRIRSIALIHQQLYRSDDLSRIPFSAYCRELSSLLSEMIEDRKKIVIKVDADEASFDIEHTKALGLIINEAVTNSLRYAFPDGRKGEVSIEFRKGTSCRLTIRDNGIGMPDPAPPQAGNTLGLFLMRSLVEELGGKLGISNEGGTNVTVTFPCRSVAEGTHG